MLAARTTRRSRVSPAALAAGSLRTGDVGKRQSACNRERGAESESFHEHHLTVLYTFRHLG
jgi:hypothetical protein